MCLRVTCRTHCLFALELVQHLFLDLAGAALVDLEELVCHSIKHVQVHTAVDVLPPMLVVGRLWDLGVERVWGYSS